MSKNTEVGLQRRKLTTIALCVVLQHSLITRGFGEVVYECTFQRCDRVICIPLEVGRVKTPCILDTGAELTLLDLSVPVGQFITKGTLRTAVGQIAPNVAFYESPEIRFGRVREKPRVNQ